MTKQPAGRFTPGGCNQKVSYLKESSGGCQVFIAKKT
jgi:hypothetical protein